MDASQHTLNRFRMLIRDAKSPLDIRHMAVEVAQFIDYTQRRFGRYMLEVGDPSPEWVGRHGRTLLNAIAVGRALERRIAAMCVSTDEFEGFPELGDDDVQRNLGELRATMVVVAALMGHETDLERSYFVESLYRKLDALAASGVTGSVEEGGGLARGLASDLLASIAIRQHARSAGES